MRWVSSWLYGCVKSFGGVGKTLETTGTRVANYDVLKFHLNEQTRRLEGPIRRIGINQEFKESRGVVGSLPSLLTLFAPRTNILSDSRCLLPPERESLREPPEPLRA